MTIHWLHLRCAYGRGAYTVDAFFRVWKFPARDRVVTESLRRGQASPSPVERGKEEKRMRTKAVRLYGADDLRLEEFDLPDIADDEILVRVITDSICMSTYKLLKQGKAHKRCPQDVDTHPIIIGHEFAGDIVKVGKK